MPSSPLNDAKPRNDPAPRSSRIVETDKELRIELPFHLNIDELAGSVNFSRSHLDREFKRYMGTSLGKYIRLITIDRAKHCLGRTAESITAIAERLHFESIHHFSIFFKRHTGMSPQDYRKRTTK